MACFSRESGSWGDSCVALLGAACLLVAVLASAFTVAEWQRDRKTYRWTHCSVGHITDAVWMSCRPDRGSHSPIAHHQHQRQQPPQQQRHRISNNDFDDINDNNNKNNISSSGSNTGGAVPSGPAAAVAGGSSQNNTASSSSSSSSSSPISSASFSTSSSISSQSSSSRSSVVGFPCVRVMVSYLDGNGDHKMGILHPDVSATIPKGPDSPRCSLSPCSGTSEQNEAAVRSFTEQWRRGYEFDHFSCYVNTNHLGEVFLTRPHGSRALEVVVLLMVVVCVVCILTTAVRCRCVYLNAREARSCVPSMSFFITSSVRSMRAFLWTLAYKLFDWKLQSSMSGTLNSHDTQGLVEQYREDREGDAAIDPCLPVSAGGGLGGGVNNGGVTGNGIGATIPRSPSVGYAQPRPANAQTYTPLACPPSDIRL